MKVKMVLSAIPPPEYEKQAYVEFQIRDSLGASENLKTMGFSGFVEEYQTTLLNALASNPAFSFKEDAFYLEKLDEAQRIATWLLEKENGHQYLLSGKIRIV